MSDSEMFRQAISLYVEIASYAVPCAFAIGMCNLIVDTFFSVAFGGRLRIGGKGRD